MKRLPIYIVIACLAPGLAMAECRRPPQFLSNTFEENVTAFANYLICLHNEQERRIASLEQDVTQGRQELAELRAAYQALLLQVGQ